MGYLNMFVLNTQFDLGNIREFLFQKMVLFSGIFWAFSGAYLLPLFCFIVKNIFRLHDNNSNCSVRETIKTDNDINCMKLESPSKPEYELEAKPDKIDIKEFEDFEDDDESSKEESPKSFLQFRFHTYEEFIKSHGQTYDSLLSNSEPTMSSSKYEFRSDKGYSAFFEESNDVNYTVKELYLDSKDDSSNNKEIFNVGLLPDKDLIEQGSENGAVLEEIQKGSVENLNHDHEVQFSSEDFTVDSDSESISSSREFSVKKHFMDSNSDGFLSDRDFGGEFKFDASMGINGETINLGKNDESDHNITEEDDKRIMEELQKLEDANFVLEDHDHNENDDDEFIKELQNLETESPNPIQSNFLSEKDFKIEEDDHDSQDLETLWEHQELIEQLKMELRKVRATGLPTIFEESEESPKIMEDLQPWKIEEKYQHEDTMTELHKFHKSYKERMRKFDILNYQKMYALGFLQSKDPLQAVTSSKSSSHASTSFLSVNFLRLRRQKDETDPKIKFVKELHSDLETVYVGHLCLSWEFLHWQYEKALELWESDQLGIHRYNEVADNFQQFQVLLQRFIEDEPFQGPRVKNYVKTRCVLRNLLQVPVIREDKMKDKIKARRGGRDRGDITSDMLVEIMEESIRIFWRFVRADKHENNTILKGIKDNQIELQDPADSTLLNDLRITLQKKEKKLKEALRTGTCILKRFQKSKDENSDQVLYFFSQVDMKLVSRVLNMSKITSEQLVWCRNKLDRISFVNRRIRVESTFLPFPC